MYKVLIIVRSWEGPRIYWTEELFNKGDIVVVPSDQSDSGEFGEITEADLQVKDEPAGKILRKIFSKEENETKNVPSYNISSITSYKEGGLWAVVLHIESTMNNETKDNDLVVKINKKGEVIEFNGKKIK